MPSPTAIAAYLALFAGVGFVFLFSNLLLGWLLRPRAPNREKLEVYECGEPTIGSSFVQFDLRFYVVALLFIIFDVEIAFFFPWAEVFGRAEEPVTRFAVVLLAASQRVLAGRFAAAGRPGARLMLGDVPHRRGPVSGALIVEGGLAALECSTEQVRPAGDHLLVIAGVIDIPYVSDAGDPLVRFRRHYLPSKL